MKIRKNTAGFTLVEIMIVVAIIGLLAAIAVPNFIQARTQARTNACINNLRLIDAGKEQWALANNKAEGDSVAEDDVAPYMKGGTFPTCPAEGTYSVENVGTDPTCTTDGHVLNAVVGS